MERIHQVLGNLVRAFNIKETYVDKNDPWLGILAAEALATYSTTNKLKAYSLFQLVFFRDMILLIKHKLNWELIRQQRRRKLIKRISVKILKEFTTTIES